MSFLITLTFGSLKILQLSNLISLASTFILLFVFLLISIITLIKYLPKNPFAPVKKILSVKHFMIFFQIFYNFIYICIQIIFFIHNIFTSGKGTINLDLIPLFLHLLIIGSLKCHAKSKI